MEYTVKQLADLSGVSARTLRYYDQIDLLKPSYVTDKGYRIYKEEQVDRLQQILFFRSLDFSLTKIKQVMDSKNYSELEALEQQQRLLLIQKKHLDSLLTNIQKTIEHYKGEKIMTDSEKFTAFKENAIKDNEKKYGDEIRKNYGVDTVDQANKKYRNLTKEQFTKMNNIEKQLIDDLNLLSKKTELDSELSQKIYLEHKEWLEYSWPNYSKEAHRGLVQMYVNDGRFAKYYDDKAGKPVTELLKKVVEHFTE